MTLATPPTATTSPRAFLWESGLAFVLLTLVLVWRQETVAVPSDHWLIRTGILRDLVAELPTGRQAALASLAYLPLSVLAALPFLPFLPASAYGYATLYGLAALLALAAPAWRWHLRRWGAGPGQWLATPILAGLAALLGPTAHADLLGALAMLLLASHFEQSERAELRALAGVFWGLACLAHLAGLAVLGLRLLLWLITWPRWRHDRETRAVHWIQASSLLYLGAVYLFLNWMIMGSALHPWRQAHWSQLWPTRQPSPAAPLADLLARHCPGWTPVVSGHWGYTIHPLLREQAGYHFLDFHPSKLPPDETRPLVLVVPTATNPLSRLADLHPQALNSQPGKPRFLMLAQTSDWRFFLIDPATYRPAGQ